jgi:hypothetical protein
MTACRASSIGFCERAAVNSTALLTMRTRRCAVRTAAMTLSVVSLAIASIAHDNRHRDVENLSRSFGRPLATIQIFFEVMMRDFASSLFRWLIVTARGSIFFRHDEAEFPRASQTACNLLKGTERGSRAADGAPLDALRPLNNRLNTQDQYELSFIRETLSPFARRFSTEGRSPSASTARSHEGPKEDILAATRCTFWKRQKHKEAGRCIAQWFAAAATGAQT